MNYCSKRGSIKVSVEGHKKVSKEERINQEQKLGQGKSKKDSIMVI